MADPVSLMTPIGRYVGGSLYKGSTVDDKGQPLIFKTGASKGQPMAKYSFGIAIRKGGEQHWASTEWGQKIWSVGHTSFPAAAQRPDFAWKVTDGDSSMPNKKGKKPCDCEGYPGCWVLWFSTSGHAGQPSPIRVCTHDGSQLITEIDRVKPGDYIQVLGSVGPNDGQTPGVYLNPVGVAFSGEGERISFGPDLAGAGFGGTLPPGAKPVPAAVPGFVPPPAAPQVPVVPPAAPQAPMAAQTVVSPHYAPIVPPAAPQVPVAPPPSAVRPRVMTPAANGVPYEQYVGAGWTDEMLIQHGMMAP